MSYEVLDLDSLVKRTHRFTQPFQVADGDRFKLKDYDPKNTLDLESKDKPIAKEMLKFGIQSLSQLEERLYANARWSVLLIFQAMDAAGKDSAIKHVMSGVNPQGCQVHSFKAPSGEELEHDYMWRCMRRLPERGRIGIFNRSYYEEMLVVRVHPQLLSRQKIPAELVTKDIWKQRFEDVRGFERYLTRNGVLVRKFFLHVSKKEQLKRFLSRLDEPHKNWKFSLSDTQERQFWDDYMHAYEDAIRQTATPESPWYVVPADHKWFTRLVVAAVIVETLAKLDLEFPKPDEQQLADLATARQTLLENEDA